MPKPDRQRGKLAERVAWLAWAIAWASADPSGQPLAGSALDEALCATGRAGLIKRLVHAAAAAAAAAPALITHCVGFLTAKFHLLCPRACGFDGALEIYRATLMSSPFPDSCR